MSTLEEAIRTYDMDAANRCWDDAKRAGHVGQRLVTCSCGTKHYASWYRVEAIGPVCDTCYAAERGV